MKAKLSISMVFCLSASLGWVCQSSRADLVVYSASDSGAGSTDQRPNSDAKAQVFSQVASSLGPVTVYTFGAAPLGEFSSLSLNPGLTITAPSATEANRPIITADSLGTPDSAYGYDTTEGGRKFLTLQGSEVVLTFSRPIQAFRAYFTGVQFSGETIFFSDGSQQVVPIDNPRTGITFLGFTDVGKSITSLTIHAGNDIIGIDDIRIVPAAVPEPASATLAASSLLVVVAVRRRRRLA